MSSLLHSPLTRFPLRFFHYHRLPTLQHLNQHSSTLSSPFLLLHPPHSSSSSSSSRSFSSVVATFLKSSIKPCSYIKNFLFIRFPSLSLFKLKSKMLTDNTSKEEEVADQLEEEYLDLDCEVRGVTRTFCHQVNPNEWQNRSFVFKITDNPGDMKITLKGRCDLSESIQVVVHLPEDGHAYHERDMHFDVTVVDKADQRHSNYSIRAYSGLRNFDCYCNTTPKMSGKASRLFLKARGIDMSLEIFFRDYLIEKYLREDLIPNLKDGY